MYVFLLYTRANWGIGRYILQKATAGSIQMNPMALGLWWEPQQVWE